MQQSKCCVLPLDDTPILKIWQGLKDLNLYLAVLETDMFPLHQTPKLRRVTQQVRPNFHPLLLSYFCCNRQYDSDLWRRALQSKQILKKYEPLSMRSQRPYWFTLHINRKGVQNTRALTVLFVQIISHCYFKRSYLFSITTGKFQLSQEPDTSGQYLLNTIFTSEPAWFRGLESNQD